MFGQVYNGMDIVSVGPSSIETMSNDDYIENVLCYNNPTDYYREQDTCLKYRELILRMKKSA